MSGPDGNCSFLTQDSSAKASLNVIQVTGTRPTPACLSTFAPFGVYVWNPIETLHMLPVV